VKKYTQNNKGMASHLSASQLLENCHATGNQMRIWGCSPPHKRLKLWNRTLLKKPRKTQKAFSGMANPRKSLPWGSAQFLKYTNETAAEMLMKLLLEC